MIGFSSLLSDPQIAGVLPNIALPPPPFRHLQVFQPHFKVSWKEKDSGSEVAIKTFSRELRPKGNETWLRNSPLENHGLRNWIQEKTGFTNTIIPNSFD